MSCLRLATPTLSNTRDRWVLTGLQLEPVGADDAERAARMWRHGEGLSLADRLCPALADRVDEPVLTADLAWGPRAGFARFVDRRTFPGAAASPGFEVITTPSSAHQTDPRGTVPPPESPATARLSVRGVKHLTSDHVDSPVDLGHSQVAPHRVELIGDTLIVRHQEAERVRRELDRLYRELLAGSAMFSMPPLVREHFARFGIPVRLVRMNSTKDEPDIPGHERSFWSVALPIDEGGRNIFKMLLAVADLDQEKPFLRVIDFAIRPDPENPTARMASMNVSVLNRK